MRSILSLASLLIMTAGSVAAAANAPIASASLSNDLSSLEVRLFEHDYQSDDIDNRLTRLEKMVFGEAKTGSEQHRLTDLLTAMPTPAPEIASDAASGVSSAQPATPSNQFAAAPDDGASEQVVDGSQYPHVTALEHELLNRTYVDQPVTKRLDQLELKAFGKTSTSNDLSFRVDKLEQYVDTHLHVRPFGTNPEMEVADLAPIYDTNDGRAQGRATPASYSAPSVHSGQPGFVAAPSSSSSLLDKVTWMEGQVFGQTYSDEHLLARLRRLEQKLFPNEHPTSDMQLMDRVDPLMGAVQLLQHQRQQTSAPQYIASSAGAQPALHSQQVAGPEPSQGGNSAHDSHHPFMKSLAECLGAAGNMGLGTTGNAVGGPWY